MLCLVTLIFTLFFFLRVYVISANFPPWNVSESQAGAVGLPNESEGTLKSVAVSGPNWLSDIWFPLLRRPHARRRQLFLLPSANRRKQVRIPAFKVFFASSLLVAPHFKAHFLVRDEEM